MLHRTRALGLLAVLGLLGLGLLLVEGQGAKPAKLVIAAVAGDEDLGLKAVAPLYEKETGIKLEIVESPYPQLYEKLVTTFQAGGQTIDMAMVDDPWMPKFGTEGWLEPLDALGFTRDPDIPTVVYDVGTWPPPRGPVPLRRGTSKGAFMASPSWVTWSCSPTARTTPPRPGPGPTCSTPPGG
jgi:ABC-type glycerol-3-phosphate transport system substrate-binding protein